MLGKRHKHVFVSARFVIHTGVVSAIDDGTDGQTERYAEFGSGGTTTSWKSTFFKKYLFLSRADGRANTTRKHGTCASKTWTTDGPSSRSTRAQARFPKRLLTNRPPFRRFSWWKVKKLTSFGHCGTLLMPRTCEMTKRENSTDPYLVRRTATR